MIGLALYVYLLGTPLVYCGTKAKGASRATALGLAIFYPVAIAVCFAFGYTGVEDE